MKVVRSYILAIAACLMCYSYGFASQKTPHLTSRVIKLTNSSEGYAFVTPAQTIDAATNVDPGEVVVAKVGVIASPPQYLEGVTYRWLVYSNGKLHKNVQVMPDNKSIFFGAGIKAGRKFTVILSASYLYIVRDTKDKTKVVAIGQRANIVSTEIVVGDLPVPPDPGPTPTPVVIPDGKYKLGKSVYDLLMANVSNAGNRVKGAQALAKSFRGMASAVAAGTVKNSKDLLTQTASANRGALTSAGLNPAEWDTFFARLQPVIYDLYSKNQIASLTDFATAWNEIATGLEAVR